MRRLTKNKKQRIKNLGTGLRKESLDKMLLWGYSIPQTRKTMMLIFNETLSEEVLKNHRRDLFIEHSTNLREARELGRSLLKGSRKMPWLSKNKKIRDEWYRMKAELRGEEFTPDNL